RTTSILGWGCIVRFGEGRIVWQSCRAAAGAAINMVCAALLAVTPPRPDLTLMTADICLKLRRPRQACDAVAGVNATDVPQVADPDRTAGEITNIAAALRTRGLRAEAKCAAPLLLHRAPPLPGPHLSYCWKKTFAPPAATYRWSNGQNSRTFCENR